MKELIILGTGDSHIHCPYDKEVWGVNGVIKFAKRLDVLFFFDDLEEVYKDGQLEEWDKKGTTFVSKKKIEKFKKSVAYPLKELTDKWNIHYFINSISYMLLLALDQGIEKIHLYGVDLVAGEREQWERAGIEFLIGFMLARGVQFEIAKGSNVCPRCYYGYDVKATKDFNKEKDNGK